MNINEIVCLVCEEIFLIDINGGTCPYCELEYTVKIEWWPEPESEDE